VTVAWPLRIYYDAACPLCAQEMHALAAHDLSARLQLVDCSAQDFHDPHLAEAGICPKQAMDFIHARDAQGRWLKGVAVFEAAYAAIGVHAIERLLSNPWLRPAWDGLYPHVANNRMWLSRLGLNRLFGRLVSMAAGRAAIRAMACDENRCDTNQANRPHA
jgi:predicted DCC family thiol-disulfide oxidoreductase YuxK